MFRSIFAFSPGTLNLSWRTEEKKYPESLSSAPRKTPSEERSATAGLRAAERIVGRYSWAKVWLPRRHAEALSPFCWHKERETQNRLTAAARASKSLAAVDPDRNLTSAPYGALTFTRQEGST